LNGKNKKNPKSRMAHLGAFAPCTSLIGGLIKFFMIIISVIGYGGLVPPNAVTPSKI
jgi:hypothetical protein